MSDTALILSALIVAGAGIGFGMRSLDFLLDGRYDKGSLYAILGIVVCYLLYVATYLVVS